MIHYFLHNNIPEISGCHRLRVLVFFHDFRYPVLLGFLVYFEFRFDKWRKNNLISLLAVVHLLLRSLRACPSPHPALVLPHCGLTDSVSVGFLLGSLSCPTDLCVWLRTMPHCLDYCSFLAQFEIRCMTPPALVSFLKIQGIFVFDTNFRIFCSSSMKMPLVFWLWDSGCYF